MGKRVDLRYTYICAHCGGFAEISFWSIEVFDSGTMLTCDKCSKNTVMLLARPSVYANLTVHLAEGGDAVKSLWRDPIITPTELVEATIEKLGVKAMNSEPVDALQEMRDLLAKFQHLGIGGRL